MDILISGASTGIGRACAVQLARKGHNVWAGVRSQKSFDEITRMNVQGLTPVFLDVVDEKSIREAVSRIKKTSGVLHALVNNAGVAIGGPIEALRSEDWRRQFDTNFFGLIDLTRAALPMIRESKGRVVNISSISGRLASPFLGPYSASKFAVEAFSDSLRREMRHFGVTVCIIEPGPIKTPIWEKSVGVAEQMQGVMNKEMVDLYGSALEKFKKLMTDSGTSAPPVSVVVKAVEHALTAKVPQTRYPVGQTGIGLLVRAANVVPDKWMDVIMKRKV